MLNKLYFPYVVINLSLQHFSTNMNRVNIFGVINNYRFILLFFCICKGSIELIDDRPANSLWLFLIKSRCIIFFITYNLCPLSKQNCLRTKATNIELNNKKNFLCLRLYEISIRDKVFIVLLVILSLQDVIKVYVTI